MIKIICGQSPTNKFVAAMSGKPDWYWLVDDKNFSLPGLVKRIPDLLIIDECSDLEVKKYINWYLGETITIPIDGEFNPKTIFFPDTIVIVKNWPCQDLIRDLKHAENVELVIIE